MLVDGDLAVSESNTICRYLARREGRTDLLPAEAAQSAAVEQWMDWQATELNSAWRYVFMARVRRHPAWQDEAAAEASALEWNRLMGLLDTRLGVTGAYVGGPSFTLANVVLGLSAHRWARTPMARPSLPTSRGGWTAFEADPVVPAAAIRYD